MARCFVVVAVLVACGDPAPTPEPPGAVADPASSALLVSPRTLLADGRTRARITVRVRDADGRALRGEAVAFAADGATLEPPTAVTGFEGVATVWLVAPVGTAPAVTVHASVADIELTADLAVIAPAAPCTGMLLLPGPPVSRVGIPGFSVVGVVARDFDRDGHVDVVTDVGFARGRGDGTFEVPRALPGGTSFAWPTAADLDGDGLLELITWRMVLRGRGDGTFMTPTTPNYGLAESEQITNVIAGDLTGDGVPDLAATIQTSTATRVSVLVNAGAGVLDAPISVTIARSANPTLAISPHGELAVATEAGTTVYRVTGGALGATDSDALVGTAPQFADFDGDARADLVMTSPTGDALLFAHAVGDGTFGPLVRTPGGPEVEAPPLVVDADLDGDADVVVGHVTYRSAGDGTFAPLVGVANYAVPRLAFDANDDGRTDLIAFHEDKIEVIEHRADGVFVRGERRTELWDASYPTLGDLDGDGVLDLFQIQSITDQEPAVLRGLGDGTFSAPIATPLAQDLGYSGVAVADFDLDGRDDMAVADPGRIRILRSTGTALELASTIAVPGQFARVATGDFNGDGVLDLASVDLGDDHALVILRGDGRGGFDEVARATWGDVEGNPFTIGDFDGDGATDLVARVQRGLSVIRVVDGRLVETVTDVVTPTQVGPVAYDENRDGKLDVLLGDRRYHGMGDGTFKISTSPLPVRLGYDGVVADFDRDGTDDIVEGALVHRGLATTATYAPVTSGGVVADLDRDGDLDVSTFGFTLLQSGCR